MVRPQVQTGDPSTSGSLEFMVREIQALSQEISSLKRETRAVLGLVVTAAGIVAPLQQNLDTNIAAILLPFLLVGLASYGFNLNAEIAAMAEQRDRLSEYVNRTAGTKIFLGRVIQDNRRGSLGTALTWILAGVIVVGSIVVGVIYAAQEPRWVFLTFAAFMLFSVGAMFFSVLDLPLTRHHVNRALDLEVGDVDRPSTSPSGDLTRWQTVKNSLFGRRGAAERKAAGKPDAPDKVGTDLWSTKVVDLSSTGADPIQDARPGATPPSPGTPPNPRAAGTGGP